MCPDIVLHVRLRYFSIIPLTIENFLLSYCKVCSVILPWSYAEQVGVGCTFETIFCCSMKKFKILIFQIEPRLSTLLLWTSKKMPIDMLSNYVKLSFDFEVYLSKNVLLQSQRR